MAASKLCQRVKIHAQRAYCIFTVQLNSKYKRPSCMFTSDEQISPPSLVLKSKSCQVLPDKYIPKAEQLKRIFTPKKSKCEEFCLQTRLGGEICAYDVIMHKAKGYWTSQIRSIAIHVFYLYFRTNTKYELGCYPPKIKSYLLT